MPSTIFGHIGGKKRPLKNVTKHPLTMYFCKGWASAEYDYSGFQANVLELQRSPKLHLSKMKTSIPHFISLLTGRDRPHNLIPSNFPFL